MGILQRGINQALTGATFLLQQTPMWQEKAKERESLKNVMKSAEQAQNLSKYATKQVGNISRRKSTKTLEGFNPEKVESAITEAQKVESEASKLKSNVIEKLGADPKLAENYKKAVGKGKTPNIESIYNPRFQKHLKELQRALDQYREQEENMRLYKGELKKEDVEQLKKMGISEEAIKRARYI